jgi:AmmeMemoRadiSam system radical SAM enzyme/AmmeMemoRadiSam system protein B/AmmeMemoRadiSam system protein A
LNRVVTLPPADGLRSDGTVTGGWWHEVEGAGRIHCDLCPRDCTLKPGDHGFCFVRENRGGEMVLSTYGRSTGFCVDPIEKKPLNHFYPGTAVLSFGTAGCNLGCKFCQNWDISKSREIERLSEVATPESIAEAARQLGCHSVAFTYNDPVIWAEYAIDTARACHAVGVRTVAVTAGYITELARGPFYEVMDAANVDLKGFTEDFYQHLTLSHLQPVLDTLAWLKHETDVWFEITNLIIPQANDSLDEIRQMCDWVLEHVGDEVPIHFTAFHPDFRLRDRPPTPHETLLVAYEAARKAGLKYVYVGNVNDVAHQSTYCPHCSKLLIQRDWHLLGVYQMRGDRCGHCGGSIAGHFDAAPGTWGRRRLPVRITDFARPLPVVNLNQRGTTMSTSTPTQTAPVDERPQLTDEQKQLIHQAANAIVAAEIIQRPPQIADVSLGGAAGLPVMGSFVTLKRRDRLRACCGFLGQTATLAEALQHAAKQTATQDVRLPPISPTELPYLDVDVSLLYGMTPVTASGTARVAEVEVGRHGLQIRRGQSGGLLLPSVAVENELDAEEFLRQVCRKAGLPSTAWQDDETQLLTFESFSISGPFDASLVDGQQDATVAMFSADDIKQLAEHCRNNIIALLRGATPNYYLPGCSDATVRGVAIALKRDGEQQPLRFAQFSLRPGMPLQSTLFTLSEAAANALRTQGVRAADFGKYELGLTMLADSAMHGTVADADLRGVDPAKRALLVSENNKTGWVFDPGLSPDKLLEAAAREAHVTNPEAAGVYSLAALSNESSVTVTSVPSAQAGPVTRPAAVAGAFYPSDAGELSRLVDKLLADGDEPPQPWPAVMVPHAGLIYSGRIAAETFRQVQIPDTVIVIGPKHTRLGVEWSVAPHEVWSLPGGTVMSDPELARQLVAAIPGLQLDAAAHQQEHAIEVELPFLSRLAPQTRVVGIAIGGGNLQRCREFATGLANVLRTQTKQPLLVISSDMNHFATDAENRRLDEMAMSALERLDPANVFQTVTDHDISMCGVLPAVIVLETLRQLGTLKKSHRVAYATSADVSGDTTRVVGYAGMLFG